MDDNDADVHKDNKDTSSDTAGLACCGWGVTVRRAAFLAG
jgi:hypothetical protein